MVVQSPCALTTAPPCSDVRNVLFLDGQLAAARPGEQRAESERLPGRIVSGLSRRSVRGQVGVGQ